MNGPGYLANVALNGRMVRADEARISPMSDGFMYGDGLFETIKLLGGKPAFFLGHYERLSRSAAELGLPFAAPQAELRARCEAVAAANGLETGSLKVLVYREAGGSGELIAAREGAYTPDAYARGFRLKTVEAGLWRGGLHAFKTLNQLGNLAARRQARSAGFDEALFVAEGGTLLEGSMTNVFAIVEGTVLTPPADRSILPGVARSVVLRLLEGRDVREAALSASQLGQASEVFVTNALLGVMPVSGVDGLRFDVARNRATAALMAAYRTAEAESTRSP
jgi:branched-subunit amino acid aminotransferase/4-amino-4-deoxychorismate lyase